MSSGGIRDKTNTSTTCRFYTSKKDTQIKENIFSDYVGCGEETKAAVRKNTPEAPLWQLI
jgi:hypothetical protein